MPERIDVESVVIGSGAGGATAYRELARAGRDVLLLEEGSAWPASGLPSSVADRMSLTYRRGGLQPIMGVPIIPFGEGRLLGGTTEVNGGLLWRTPEPVLRDWRSHGLFSDVSEFDLGEIFTGIEDDLGVGLTAHDPLIDTDSELLRRGAEDLDWTVVRAPRAAPGCSRANLCASVCPTGAKRSMSLTYIPDGTAHGGRIRTDVRVERLSARDGRVQGVLARDLITGQQLAIRAREVLLAAGALQTPLLLGSARGYRPILGRLGLHLNTKVLALMPQPLSATRSTIFSWQIQEFMDEGILIMPANLRPEYLAMATAGADNATVAMLQERIDHVVLLTTMIRPHAYGSVLRFGRDALGAFRLDPSDRSLLRRSVEKATELLFHEGAERAYLPLAGLPETTSQDETVAMLDRAGSKDWQLTSVHAMSSLPASLQESGPVDVQGRARGLSNVWVVDASALPTTLGESPQGTIMAWAQATVRRLVR